MPGKDWFNSKQGIEIIGSYANNYHMAIINMKPNEDSETAWQRHLAANPGDVTANIKVFNRAPNFG